MLAPILALAALASPPAGPPGCIEVHPELGRGQYATRFSVNGGYASFCLSEDQGCWEVDLASGEYIRGPNRQGPDALYSGPRVQPLTPPMLTVRATADEVQVCGLGEEDCFSVRPDRSGEAQQPPSQPIDAHVDATGALLAMTWGDEPDEVRRVETWSLKRRKRIKRFAITKKGKDPPCGTAIPLGPKRLYVETNICAGPAGQAEIRTIRGRRVKKVGGRKAIGTFATVPIQIEGNLWAFVDEQGTSVVVQDVRKGRVKHRIDLGPVVPKSPDGLPMTDPGHNLHARGPDQTVVILMPGPIAGDVVVVDPLEGKIVKHLRPPVCEAKKAP